jgi:hypothetical protein
MHTTLSGNYGGSPWVLEAPGGSFFICVIRPVIGIGSHVEPQKGIAREDHDYQVAVADRNQTQQGRARTVLGSSQRR